MLSSARAHFSPWVLTFLCIPSHGFSYHWGVYPWKFITMSENGEMGGFSMENNDIGSVCHGWSVHGKKLVKAALGGIRSGRIVTLQKVDRVAEFFYCFFSCFKTIQTNKDSGSLAQSAIFI